MQQVHRVETGLAAQVDQMVEVPTHDDREAVNRGGKLLLHLVRRTEHLAGRDDRRSQPITELGLRRNRVLSRLFLRASLGAAWGGCRVPRRFM